MKSKKIHPLLALLVTALVLLTIGGLYYFFPRALGSDRIREVAAIGVVALMAVLMYAIGKRGVQSARSGKTSVSSLIIIVLIGFGFVSVSELFPILGLGGLLIFYGLPGLITVGLRKLSKSDSK